MKLLDEKRCNFQIFGSQLLQHLNPACRAARKVPELSMSRLLISLTDYDMPMPKSYSRGLQRLAKYVSALIIMAAASILFSFPELAQTLVLETLFGSIINFLYFALVANGNNLVLSVSIGTGIIVGVFLCYECIMRRSRASVYISG